MNNISEFPFKQLNSTLQFLKYDLGSNDQCLRFLKQCPRSVFNYFKTIQDWDEVGLITADDDDDLRNSHFFGIPKFLEKQRHLIKWGKRYHQHIFKTIISQDLIAEVFHPRRIQQQIDQFEDIEDYFNSL